MTTGQSLESNFSDGHLHGPVSLLSLKGVQLLMALAKTRSLTPEGVGAEGGQEVKGC